MNRLKLRKSMSGVSDEHHSPSSGGEAASGGRGGSSRRLAATSASGISGASSDDSFNVQSNSSGGMSGREARAALLALREKSVERPQTPPVMLGRTSVGPCSGAEARAILKAQRTASTPIPVGGPSASQRSLARISGSPARSSPASHALLTNQLARNSPSASRQPSATSSGELDSLTKDLTWTNNGPNISKLETILAQRTRQVSESNRQLKEHVSQVGIRVHSANGGSKSGQGQIKAGEGDPTATRVNLVRADELVRQHLQALKEKARVEALLAARDDAHLFAYLHQKLFAEEGAYGI